MIILKKIYLSEILIRSFAVMTLVAMIIPSLAFLIPQSADAATNQIRIYSGVSGGATTSTDCKFVMEKGTYGDSEGLYDSIGLFDMGDTPVNSDATRDPNGFGADYEAVKNKYNDNQQLIYMYLLPVNTGSSGENGYICTNGSTNFNGGGGILFSRPSDPTKFFGYLRTADGMTSSSGGWTYYGTGLGGDGTFVTAQFNTTTNTLNFGASGRSAGSYAVSAGSNSTGILDDAVFDNISPPGGGGSGAGVGFCSGITNPPARQLCFSARVEDFGTIKYRGETYTLKSWRGDWMDYYLSSAITSRQSLVTASDTVKPKISIDTNGGNDNGLDLNIDGDPGGNESDKADENKEFFDALNGLPNTVEVRFTDYDLSGGRIDINGNQTTDNYQTITLENVTNFRNIFKYYKQGDVVNFIPANFNPGDNEKRIVTPNLTVSPSNPLVYQAPAVSDGCSSENVLPKVVFTTDPKTTTSSVLEVTWNFPYNPTNCSIVSSAVKATIDTTNTQAPDPVTDGATAEPAAQECEDSFSSFGVIICWMLKSIDYFLGLLENIIKNLLIVSPGNYSATETNDQGNSVQQPLYTAWISLARVASGLLVIFALIMVLGTALGDYKFFNAYTVKKVLPRIVVAAVGIWLSWAIVSAYIDSINVIGKGIADLLWTPFKETTGLSFEEYGLDDVFGNASQDTGSGTEAVAGTALGFTMIGGVVTAGAVALGGGIAILSALSPVLLFMLIGFIVLVLRQSVIIFLLAVAPIAVVSWILPNTKKLIWDKWLKFLNQLLFMFPLFMGVLAAGKIFAYVASNGGDGGLLSLIIPAIAYVTPFVLLPGIFKSAGGALSKVTASGLKLGGRARKPLDDKAKARKEAIRKEGRLNAMRNIGASPDGKGSLVDRYRAGTLGMGPGFAFSGRDALKKQQKLVAEAGRNEFNKEEESLIQKEIDKMESAGTASDKNTLRAKAQVSNTNSYERKAALRRMATLGDDEGMRTLQADYAGPAASEATRQEWNKFKNSSEYYNGFKDKAPDLIKGPGAFNDVKSESMVGWSENTMKQAVQSLQSKSTSAAASGNPDEVREAQEAWARFGQSIHQVVSDPKLAGRMSNSTLGAIASSAGDIHAGLYSAGLSPTALAEYSNSVNKINNSGVITP